ncbi:MAG: alpha/beta hydrolase [Bacillota bacterium]|nr:alpha/beta hydrolase [Bacillota bacterium]
MSIAKSGIIIGAATLVVLFIFFWALSPGSTPAIKDEQGNVPADSIASLDKVDIGGMDQWILVRGKDVSNPVLLWLHGGPGAAQMPIARHFNGALEEHFIVVHWDQRGAGKSNPFGFEEQTMTFEQFVDDAHQMTQYLKKRFNKDKIYLVGHSWGSQMGIMLAHLYPDDYYAYVAVSQVVDDNAGAEIAYKWLMEEIKKKGNNKDR